MKLRKCLIGALCVLLAAAAAFCAAFFRYLPQYLEEQGPVSVAVQADGGIRMMSCNLRCLTPLDLGKRSWFLRAGLIRDDIVEQAPGIIGFQEATCWQYEYLTQTLTEYDSVITYRDDSYASEGCPIFFHTALYTLVEEGSFWLSETPETMSRDPAAKHCRICTYVVLTDKQSGKRFAVFNTHLDYASEEVRVRSIGVIREKIQQLEGIPAVIMGDFNAEPDSRTYSVATEDFLDACWETGNGFNAGTYHGWGDPESTRRIDYFLLSKTGFTVTGYTVLTEARDGVYCSDHSPILLDVTLDGIRVMTHNLRRANGWDAEEKSWEVRAELLLRDIQEQAPGIIGFQEVTPWQYEDLTQMLPGYDSVITYRDNSEGPEGCPIFYDASAYILAEKGAFWLSQTPEVMSWGWDAGYYRICSYAVLTDRKSGKAVFNLHLDTVGYEARLNGIEVVLERAEQMGSLPTIILGDFNSTEDSEVYRRVTEDFLDTFYAAEKSSGTYTFHNWGDMDKARRIDYIMISKTGFFPASYAVLPGQHGGNYSSDHCPVVVDLMIQ